MIDGLIDLDKKTIVFLNNLGSNEFDSFWLILTKQIYWTPLFLFLAYLIFKKIGLKQTLIIVLFVAVLITFTDQVTNLFKNYFQRLRPINNPEINAMLRIVKESKSFSFFSAHAGNSMAVAVFLFLNFYKNYKYFWLIFLWPLVFAYSRIYLGLHFPTDILSGYLFGGFFGFLTYKLYKSALPYFDKQN